MQQEPTLNLYPGLTGLSPDKAAELRKEFGPNKFVGKKDNRVLNIMKDVGTEPMFILLLICCFLYFIMGEPYEGFMMLIAMSIVSAISVFQEVKSSNALKALNQLTAPATQVIRAGAVQQIPVEDLVPGDLLVLSEGMNVPADATIIQANDLSLNESVITGESLPVSKSEKSETAKIFQGSIVNSGRCVSVVTETGNRTILGKIGKSVSYYDSPKTGLQIRINRFVKQLAIFGFIGFVVVFAVNYLNTGDIAPSLLFALTLAMSAAPEEIPVAFSSFMALGAFKMSRSGIISRQPQIIENLGAVTVLCLDKTGTITENRMQVKAFYDYQNAKWTELPGQHDSTGSEILRYGALASELQPFDAMEVAIIEAYTASGGVPLDSPMVHEYPLEGKPPMMTHIYKFNDTTVAAGKGAVERIMRVCKLDKSTTEAMQNIVTQVAALGHRVIAVAAADVKGTNYPEKQDDFDWKFLGFISLFDPPRTNARDVISALQTKGVRVKMITGDHAETAVNIARQVNILLPENTLTGEQVMTMTKEQLRVSVNDTNVFARMFPDAKMKVIEALKANNEIVAMTGDGVNDGPALKAASIGIAMGQKGSEMARQAADIILTDDNLESIDIAIRQGRKIFNNLKKAIRYIISIHIPIILTASVPLLLGWKYPNIFTPVHVIFLELIMGPTCSIFFENEPVEEHILSSVKTGTGNALLTRGEYFMSSLQGLMIAAAALSVYYLAMSNGNSIEFTRSMVFNVLIISNILLTLANRSFRSNISQTIRYKNNLVPWVLGISLFFLAMINLVPFFRDLFGVIRLPGKSMLICVGAGVAGVFWFELYKTIKYPSGLIEGKSE